MKGKKKKKKKGEKINKVGFKPFGLNFNPSINQAQDSFSP